MPVSGGLKAGKISKPYGLQGKVNLILEPEAAKDIETNNPLFINIDGQRVPFFVKEFDQVSFDQGIVQFEFITSIEDAKKVSGCEVYFEVAQNTNSKDRVNDLNRVVGYDASDQELGYLGKVTAYIPHDVNPVLVIDYRGKELLVPAVGELLQHINYKEQSIHFNLPEGLTTL